MEARYHFVSALVLLSLSVGADLRVCPGLGLHMAGGANTQVCPYTALSLSSVMAQTVHNVRGQVADQDGAAVKAARLTLSLDDKELRAAITDGEGRFVFNGVAAGRYSLAVKAAGFAVYQDEVTVGDAAADQIRIALSVATLNGEVEVNGGGGGAGPGGGGGRNGGGFGGGGGRRIARGEDGVRRGGWQKGRGAGGGRRMAASADRDAIVLRGDAIRRLPRDEQRLRQLLERMAGSFAGRLNVSVNGISDASLPPTATIKEIRINSDPFSAAYHEPGSARVEIETK